MKPNGTCQQNEDWAPTRQSWECDTVTVTRKQWHVNMQTMTSWLRCCGLRLPSLSVKRKTLLFLLLFFCLIYGLSSLWTQIHQLLQVKLTATWDRSTVTLRGCRLCCLSLNPRFFWNLFQCAFPWLWPKILFLFVMNSQLSSVAFLQSISRLSSPYRWVPLNSKKLTPSKILSNYGLYKPAD